jgi:hypothetical protein
MLSKLFTGLNHVVIREQGTGNREQGTGNREHRNKDRIDTY